jgi:hypothetical protein
VPPVTGHIGDWVLGQPAGWPGNQIASAYLYQPADRFWHFQFIEAGLFVVLTAAALGAAIWLPHRRPPDRFISQIAPVCSATHRH